MPFPYSFVIVDRKHAEPTKREGRNNDYQLLLVKFVVTEQIFRMFFLFLHHSLIFTPATLMDDCSLPLG
jgi:hypothetical protein